MQKTSCPNRNSFPSSLTGDRLVSRRGGGGNGGRSQAKRHVDTRAMHTYTGGGGVVISVVKLMSISQVFSLYVT